MPTLGAGTFWTAEKGTLHFDWVADAVGGRPYKPLQVMRSNLAFLTTDGTLHVSGNNATGLTGVGTTAGTQALPNAIQSGVERFTLGQNQLLTEIGSDSYVSGGDQRYEAGGTLYPTNGPTLLTDTQRLVGPMVEAYDDFRHLMRQSDHSPMRITSAGELQYSLYTISFLNEPFGGTKETYDWQTMQGFTPGGEAVADILDNDYIWTTDNTLWVHQYATTTWEECAPLVGYTLTRASLGYSSGAAIRMVVLTDDGKVLGTMATDPSGARVSLGTDLQGTTWYDYNLPFTVLNVWSQRAVGFWALADDGKIYHCGYVPSNSWARGSLEYSLPTGVHDFGIPGGAPVMIGCTASFSLMLDVNGDLWYTGTVVGDVGTSPTTDYSWVQVDSGVALVDYYDDTSNGAYRKMVYVKTDGSLYYWGTANYNEVSVAGTEDGPVLVPGYTIALTPPT